jgi:hypothetical protein
MLQRLNLRTKVEGADKRHEAQEHARNRSEPQQTLQQSSSPAAEGGIWRSTSLPTR